MYQLTSIVDNMICADGRTEKFAPRGRLLSVGDKF